jgi:adenylylsulfate kinase-like enzyme
VPAPASADAVLVTGVYGAGKSTVVADIGALLGERGQQYGLLDVDWLGWFDSGISHREHRRAVLGNLATISSGFVIAGVRRLALAWSVRDRAQLDEVCQAVPVPLRVVRLEAGDAPVRETSEAICSWLGWI